VIWKHDGQEGICKVVLHGKQAGVRGIDCDTRVCLAAFFLVCRGILDSLGGVRGR
jgi:hypothetical protein